MTSFRVSATLVCDGLMINLKVGEVGEEAWGAALCDVEERVTEIASITQGHSWSHSNFSSSCSQQNSQRQQEISCSLAVRNEFYYLECLTILLFYLIN
ncbi:uncharacterized protein LOC109808304 isoform X3 [Cajanus cajan]|uniref:uncharacterized protein LOC109808304 isoform X3 n=1 Tax=Cajanus cajan TaxID=3821 RepID=UPI0010FB6EDB|nr:uncharacterized protein LOC109808304 isoform X3 [Cajanus cajan]